MGTQHNLIFSLLPLEGLNVERQTAFSCLQGVFLVFDLKVYTLDSRGRRIDIERHRHIELDILLSKTCRMMILGNWYDRFTYAVFDGENMYMENYIEGETEL